MNRRFFLIGAAALGATAIVSTRAAARPTIVVYKDPFCGCCGAWIDHVRAAGFPVEAHDRSDMDRVKVRFGVPDHLASCHTALVDGYVLEGHVPAGAIERLLAQRPTATGLAVPAMPIGSPGMEIPDIDPDTYEVVLFGPDLQRRFALYRGHELLVE